MSKNVVGPIGLLGALLVLLPCAAGAASPSIIEFSAAHYHVAPGAAALVMLERLGGTSGNVTASYTTIDGSAAVGVDYTRASGSVSWSDGDNAPRFFVIPTITAGSGTLSISLLSTSGANFGSPIDATVTIGATAPSGLSIRASGNTLVDGYGNTVQLRGANYSSMESTFHGPPTSLQPQNPGSTVPAAIIQGYSNANLGIYPWWNYPAAWGMNVIRLPLNEASWLRNYTGIDPLNPAAGPELPDNRNVVLSGNYQAAVKQMVSDLVAQGFYVVLDLHWTAPGPYLGSSQDQLPDTDHSIAFWTSVAQYFGSNPAVIFDLFNEPYPTPVAGLSPFQVLLNGGPQATISCNSGNTQVPYSWTSAGMQALVNAVRATGANNLLMIGGAGGATDLSGFTAAGGGYFPNDPLHNSAASWHAYGVSSADTTINNSTYSARINPTLIANTLLAEGIPVIVGEVGDASSNGTVGAPVISQVTSWADQYGGSVIAWTWNSWLQAPGIPGPSNLLLKDALGTPTDGEGVVFRQWLLAH